MITALNGYDRNRQNNFKGITIPASSRVLDGFIKSQENLSSTRFIQDTTTNWLPKAALSRSKAEYAEFYLFYQFQ